jgi:hypothetical protein
VAGLGVNGPDRPAKTGFRLCSDQNQNYWTITSATNHYYDPYDIDIAWSWDGIVFDNKWDEHFYGLWVKHNYDVKAHLSCCNGYFNGYPHIHLRAESNGVVYVQFSADA